MSGQGSPELAAAPGEGLSVAVVAASWHAVIMEGLVESAVATIQRSGATVSVHRVPGTFELPLAAQAVAAAGFDAVVALGVVIRGGTPHFEYVCRAATDGLLRVTLDTGVPVGFGVLTCDDEQQALDRSGLEGSALDKGREAAAAALAMATLLRTVRGPRSRGTTGF